MRHVWLLAAALILPLAACGAPAGEGEQEEQGQEEEGADEEGGEEEGEG